MIVVAECSFFIPMASSLKDKRSVVKSMIERVKNQYNVSIAEMEHQNLWQRTTLVVVAVASSNERADKEVRRAIRLLESNPEWEMTELHFEQY